MIEILSKRIDRIGIGDFDSLIALKVPESEQIELESTANVVHEIGSALQELRLRS